MNVAFGTNIHAIRKKRVYYEGSDTLYEGVALCYNHDTTNNILGWDPENKTKDSTTAEGYQNEGKFLRVEKPSASNLKFFAGVVTQKDAGRTGPCWIDIIVPNGAIVPVRGTESFTIGDKIYIAAGDYEFTNVPQVGGFCGYAMETVDRSSTEGLLLAKLLPTAANPREEIAVVDKTENYTVTVSDSGKILTNTGATGAVTFTLPKAADAEGCVYTFVLTANQNLAIDPDGNEKIIFGNDTDALGAGEALTLTPADANDVGMNITLVSDGTQWIVKSAYAQAADKFAIP